MSALADITKQLHLCIQEEAIVVEQVLNNVLIPLPIGIYNKMEAQPRVQLGRVYYVNGNTWIPRTQQELEQYLAQPFGDVYNEHVQLVIPMPSVKQQQFDLRPQLALRGAAIFSSVTESIIRANSIWEQRQPIGSFPSLDYTSQHVKRVMEAISPYLIEMDTLSLANAAEHVVAIFADKAMEIVRFIGEDRWIMHFHKLANYDLTIMKSVDYRIHAWQMEHGHEYGWYTDHVG